MTAPRVFLAHPKSMEEETLTDWSSFLREQFREEYPDLQITLGRDDYNRYAPGAGSFSAWARDVPRRKDVQTGKTYYTALFVPDRYVGKATAEMVMVALNTALPVLVGQTLDDGRIMHIATRLEVVDANDYIKGWCVEVD